MSNIDETGKGSKRSKPEHDSSIEDEEKIFQRSKLVARSPIKQQEETPINMEEIKTLLLQMQKDFKEEMEVMRKEIRGDMEEIRREVGGLRKEIEQSKVEVVCIKNETDKMKEEWRKDREELTNKLMRVEEEIERVERDKVRNRLVVSGIDMLTNDDGEVKEILEQAIKRELKIHVQARKAYKIGPKRCILEMDRWEDKLTILKEKAKLKGKNIYIDSELTHKEREIQKKIRDIAREEKRKGIKVRVRYQRLELNDKVFVWNRRGHSLEEAEDAHKKPKN